MTHAGIHVVLGVDVGTSGLRPLAATPDGEVLAEARAGLSDMAAAALAHVQQTYPLWSAVC